MASVASNLLVWILFVEFSLFAIFIGWVLVFDVLRRVRNNLSGSGLFVKNRGSFGLDIEVIVIDGVFLLKLLELVFYLIEGSKGKVVLFSFEEYAIIEMH